MTYGCYNREPIDEPMYVQDGWMFVNNNLNKIPKMAWIPFRMSKTCEYTKHARYSDPGCMGCCHMINNPEVSNHEPA